MLLKRGRTIQFHICMDLHFVWNSITLVGIPRNLTLQNVTLESQSLFLFQFIQNETKLLHLTLNF